MPCKNNTHSHEWTRSGVLAIEKCESLCAFCNSDKEYKPASALRKHVATHIKNGSMPLSLAHSSGGRPKLCATSPSHSAVSNGGSRSTSIAITSIRSQSPQNQEVSLGPSSPGTPFAPADIQTPGASESSVGSPAQGIETEELEQGCWRCIIFQLECDKKTPCSECGGQDLQSVCSTKNLEDYAPLILSDDFEFPGPMHWRDPCSRLPNLSITFGEDVSPHPPSSTERYLLADDKLSCLQLLALCRPLSRPGDKLFDGELRVEQTLRAAALFESTAADIGMVVGYGLRCLSSTLRVLDAIQSILQEVGQDDAAQKKDPSGRVKQYKWKVVHESLPNVKGELRSFLSALQMRAVLTSRLFTDGDINIESLLVSENSDLVLEGITKDLQLFYGILILFIFRASLKAPLNYSIADFHAATLQSSQDPTFENNLNCPLYHPILYALGGSKVTFGKYLSMLKTKAALKDMFYLYEHYETAARLMPVSMEAPILEHVAYFFDQSTEAPNADGPADFRRRAIDASAQLVTLPMA